MPIPKALHGGIIGQGGQRIRALRMDCQAAIEVPRAPCVGFVGVFSTRKSSSKLNHSFSEISAQDVGALKKARTQIAAYVQEARESMDPTHFVCFRLMGEEFTSNVEKFRTDVRIADESVIQW